MRFRDRREAGRLLAEALRPLVDSSAIVLALPRGGVPVGYEVAQALRIPLDIFVVRKLGVPGHEELAMGAIASGGVRVINESILRSLGISEEVLARTAAVEENELGRRERLLRGDRAAASVEGRMVVLVDDGLATGSSMRAAVAAVRARKPASVIAAVPVAAGATCDEIELEADRIVCLRKPEPFLAVGIWYEQFEQVSDEEVQELLGRAQAPAFPARC